MVHFIFFRFQRQKKKHPFNLFEIKRKERESFCSVSPRWDARDEEAAAAVYAVRENFSERWAFLPTNFV